MPENLDNIHSLTDYMRTFGSIISEKVDRKHPPLFVPGSDWHPKLHRSLRAPFQGQGDAIMGVVETLKLQDSAFVVGEMGTGKSLMGALIPWVIMDSPRVLVMCPGHLTGKWKREIEATVPDAEVSIIRNLSDAMAIDAEAISAGAKPRYWIMSKETAKLGFSWRPAVGKIREPNVKIIEDGSEPRGTQEEVLCPRCGQVVTKPNRRSAGAGDEPEELPVGMDEIRRRKTYCQCGEALWQVDGSRSRKMAVADYLKKHLPRNFFDFFVADEVHELKGRDTAQGNAFGTLASCSRKTICLTGTLLGGYASHLFYLNFRINPTSMKAGGFDYRNPKKFVAQYGVEEVVTKEASGRNVTETRGSKNLRKTNRRERPGINPELFSQQLLDKAVFLHLDDVSQSLPPLSEEVIGVKMHPDVALAYRDMEEQIKEVMRPLLKTGSRRLLSTYLMNLLSYPDRPFGNPPIKLEEGNLYSPREFDQGQLYPKEEELLRLVQSELAEGRRCLIYAIFTQSRDVTERLRKILSDRGIKCQILKDVESWAREEWVREKLADGMEVMICNPELIKTGLDLVEFPTIIYVQTGYNIFTLRQSSRRSWRIGQTQPVKVFYLYYQDTMQERAVALIGRKLAASCALDGKLTEGGLTSLSGSQEGALALAKSLVEGGIEGVETIWKKLRDSGTSQVMDRGDSAGPSGDRQDNGEEEYAEPGEQIPDPNQGLRDGTDSEANTSGKTEEETPKKRKKSQRKAETSNEWRFNAGSSPGPDYKWTKQGWRKISEREKQAKARKEAEAASVAWKYDGTTSPGDDHYWVRSYSYQREVKSGATKTINVRGHWRKKRGAVAV